MNAQKAEQPNGRSLRFNCSLTSYLLHLPSYLLNSVWGVVSGCSVRTAGTGTCSTLIYIGQAFLLAGSIFGLDYYIDKVKQA